MVVVAFPLEGLDLVASASQEDPYLGLHAAAAGSVAFQDDPLDL